MKLSFVGLIDVMSVPEVMFCILLLLGTCVAFSCAGDSVDTTRGC